MVRLDAVGKGRSQCLNVVARQGRRLTIKRNEAQYAGELQHSQFLTDCHMNKDISGKQDQVEFFATVLPVADGTVQWQEIFNSALLQELRNFLFMAGVGIRGKPTTIKGRGLQTAGASFLL